MQRTFFKLANLFHNQTLPMSLPVFFVIDNFDSHSINQTYYPVIITLKIIVINYTIPIKLPFINQLGSIGDYLPSYIQFALEYGNDYDRFLHWSVGGITRSRPFLSFKNYLRNTMSCKNICIASL